MGAPTFVGGRYMLRRFELILDCGQSIVHKRIVQASGLKPKWLEVYRCVVIRRTPASRLTEER